MQIKVQTTEHSTKRVHFACEILRSVYIVQIRTELMFVVKRDLITVLINSL